MAESIFNGDIRIARCDASCRHPPVFRKLARSFFICSKANAAVAVIAFYCSLALQQNVRRRRNWTKIAKQEFKSSSSHSSLILFLLASRLSDYRRYCCLASPSCIHMYALSRDGTQFRKHIRPCFPFLLWRPFAKLRLIQQYGARSLLRLSTWHHRP